LSVSCIRPGILALNYYNEGNARSFGMANVQAVITDHWSGMGNPAGLASVTSSSIGISYINFYQVQELGMGSISLTVPTKSGTCSLNYTAFGYASYSLNHSTLSYGKALGKKLYAGIGLNCFIIHQSSGFGNLFAFVPSIGIQWLPSEPVILGVVVFNPAGQSYIPSGYLKIPSVIRIGMGFTFGREVRMYMEAEKKSNEKLNYLGGIEITFEKIIVMRLGVAPGMYPMYSFGIGFRFRQAVIDMAAIRHPVLGFSPVLTINYHFN
jgi:hypothetical protein